MVENNIKNSWLIGDQEVEKLLEGKDLLDTKSYTLILKDIIDNLQSSEMLEGFNIGLYGGRGSGKSSILRSLKREYEKDNNIEILRHRIHFVRFDCRKYNGDDLRRTFLFEIIKSYKTNNQKENENIKAVNKINFTEKEYAELNNSLYKSLYQDTETNIDPNKNEIDRDFVKKIGIYFIIFFGIFLAINIVLHICKFYDIISDTLSNILSPILNISFTVLICTKGIIEHFKVFFNGDFFKSISEKIIKKEIKNETILNNRLFSSEQFESWFNLLIGREGLIDIKNIKIKKELYKIKSYAVDRKFVFVFDNIDRCSSESIIEILRTIKTFLNQKNCIFIIPIDYKSVCGIYNNKLNFPNDDIDKTNPGNEFLRKIFNVGIHLKTPLYDKLYDYTKGIIIDNGRNVGDMSLNEEEIEEISHTLSGVFAKNPRKIKQFLNKLSVEWLRIKKEIKGEKSYSILSTLKLLIIQEEIPKLYEYLVEHPFYENKIINYLEKLVINDYLTSNNVANDRRGTRYDLEKDQLWENIPNLTANDNDLIRKLSRINSEICLFPENSLLSNYMDDSKTFFDIVREKQLQKEAKKLIENKAATFTTSKYEGIMLLNLFIQYTAEYRFDKTIYQSLFKVGSVCYKLFETGNISVKIDYIYDFINKIPIKTLKNLGYWMSPRFTELLLLSYSEQPERFDNLKDEIKECLFSEEIFSDLINNKNKGYFSSEDFENGTIYMFIKNNKKQVNEHTVNLILNNLPQATSGFSAIDNLNRLKILNIIGDLSHYPNAVNHIIRYSGNFNIDQFRYYNSNGQGNNNIIDAFFLIASISILSKYNYNNLYNTLNIIYNFNISTLQNKILKIYERDLKESNTYNWRYKNFIIDKNLKWLIELMLLKTKNNTEGLGLNDDDIRKIIRNLSWSADESEIFKLIRSFSSGKEAIINDINKYPYERIYEKINYLKINQIYNRQSEIKDIKDYLSEKVLSIIQGNNNTEISRLCEYILSHEGILDYINKKTLKKYLENVCKQHDGGSNESSVAIRDKIKECIDLISL